MTLIEPIARQYATWAKHPTFGKGWRDYLKARTLELDADESHGERSFRGLRARYLELVA